ncbi:Protein of unknown function [Arcanobacterium phocae]|uniref:DUF998 domain-containing protein n=2 Tax=Arcanobacterium phocae TaxID=131112 RepID=A0A1H2LIU6_9ACTO|nr:DUF998 domain-containing protein [Arcanobacterium phocae]SDU80501.1 Protein of unknown function [Arcanobacterium phocae]
MVAISPSSRVFKLGIWLCVISGIMYASFILEAIFGFPLDPRLSYLSEYFALDSPYRLIFATSDLLTATLALAGLICLADFKRSWSRTQTFVATCYSVFAIATFFDVIFPLKCAESLDFCEKTGLTAHLVASSIVSGSLLLIAAIATVLAITKRIAPRYRLVLIAISIIYICLTLLIAVLDFTVVPIGYLQRFQVFFACLILATAGIILRPYEYHRSRVSLSS